MNRKIYNFTHDTGLRASLCMMPGFSSKYAELTVNFGSRDIKFHTEDGKITEIPKGTAHFLEHMVFEEPETKDGDVIPDRLTSLGADANAATSCDSTVFYFTCTENFGECLETLLDMVLFPKITPIGAESEKEIIKREICTDSDTPEYISGQTCLEMLYPDDPLKDEIAGTPESVDMTDSDVLNTVHSFFYVPENMILSAAGDITPEEFKAAVSRALDGKTFGKVPEKLPCAAENNLKTDEIRLVPCGSDTVSVSAGIRDDVYTGLTGRAKAEHAAACEAVTELLFGASSDFFAECYADGIIDSGFSAGYVFDCCHAVFTFDGNSDCPEKLLSRIRRTISRANVSGFSEEDTGRLARAFGGGYAMELDSVESVGSWLTESALTELSAFDYFNACVTIKTDIIKETVGMLSESRIAMAAAGRIKEK